jgi:hypothetical protein
VVAQINKAQIEYKHNSGVTLEVGLLGRVKEYVQLCASLPATPLCCVGLILAPSSLPLKGGLDRRSGITRPMKLVFVLLDNHLIAKTRHDKLP